MAGTSKYIQVGNEKLHCLHFGRGKELLIAFHGYGNDAYLFEPFVTYLEEKFIIICVDLPHHGGSKWPANTPLQKKDLLDLINTFKSEFQVSKVSLLGYSMGGRVCLTAIELMPGSIDKVLLIAPDGLVFNPLYYFVTQTSLGKKMFRGLITNPRRYLRFIDWLKEKQWLDISRHKFVTNYIGTNDSRAFLLKVWPDMSNITPDIKKLKSAIRQYKIPVFIFMGMYDKIIPAKHAHRFSKGLSSVELYILEKGHRVFDHETLPGMAECLLA